MSEGLFPAPPSITPAPAEPKLSVDRRRTAKQQAALARGAHPTSLYFQRTVRLHPDAAPADSRTADGLRCRTCARLSNNGWGYLKCSNVGDSHSAATDMRAWWPACVNYEAARA
ncbi:hypothetical protein [Actinocorallia longicatena]|uniref:High-potential iron-sulfur protein n=1 Tax=Actinocorallia longicatena TaxID=111803 RepID=A0ABP6QK07_9ACTN